MKILSDSGRRWLVGVLQVVVAMQCAACITHSGGGESVNPPLESRGFAPGISIDFADTSAAEVRAAPSGLGPARVNGGSRTKDFIQVFQERLDGDLEGKGFELGTSDHLRLAVSFADTYRMSAAVFASLLFLWIIPFPSGTTELQASGSLHAVGFEPHVLPKVRRTSESWAGIPLIPFAPFVFAIRDGDRDLSNQLAAELALRVENGCVSYAEQAWASTEGRDAGRYANFLDAFPGSRHQDVASRDLEALLWIAINSSDDPRAHLDYLSRFPESAKADSIRRDKRKWLWGELAEAGDPDVMAEFFTVFQDGQPSERRAYDECRWRHAVDSKSVESYELYAKELPHGKWIDEVNDALAWAVAESVGTTKAVSSYLSSWPDGDYSEWANTVLEILHESRSTGADAAISVMLKAYRVRKPEKLRAVLVDQTVTTATERGSLRVSEHSLTMLKSLPEGSVIYNGTGYHYRQGTWVLDFPMRFHH
ncbi:MAG: hypothetical protein ACI8QZ_002879 [Chlamydiales bacterium]|jgi:hypothetical protein